MAFPDSWPHPQSEDKLGFPLLFLPRAAIAPLPSFSARAAAAPLCLFASSPPVPHPPRPAPTLFLLACGLWFGFSSGSHPGPPPARLRLCRFSPFELACRRHREEREDARLASSRGWSDGGGCAGRTTPATSSSSSLPLTKKIIWALCYYHLSASNASDSQDNVTSSENKAAAGAGQGHGLPYLLMYWLGRVQAAAGAGQGHGLPYLLMYWLGRVQAATTTY